MAARQYKPAAASPLADDHNIHFSHATNPQPMVRMTTAQLADNFYFTPEQARVVARCLLVEADAADAGILQ